MSHLLGVAIVRYISEVAPLAELPFEQLIERVSPAIQLHLAS